MHGENKSVPSDSEAKVSQVPWLPCITRGNIFHLHTAIFAIVTVGCHAGHQKKFTTVYGWKPPISAQGNKGRTYNQWPFQEPKLEVPTIYKAYVRAM